MRPQQFVVILTAGIAAASIVGCSRAGSGSASTASGASAPAAASGPVTLTSIPHRKAGLWKMTMTSDRANAVMPSTEMCVDEASEAKQSALSVGRSQDNCSQKSLSRNLDGSITFNSTCSIATVPGAQTTAKGVITGSFDGSYKMEMESTTTGMPVAGANGTHKMSIAADYEGPCPAGAHGGDMTVTLPNGQKMTMAASMMGGPGGQ